MALLPDGKILVVGEASGAGGGSTDVALAQFNQDGTPDLTFGTGGMRSLDLYGGDDHINAVVLQNGKIILAGDAYRPSDTATYRIVLQLKSDGTLDGSFGTGGVVATPTTVIGTGRSVGVESDGSLIVVGPATSAGQSGFGVTHYSALGIPDTSFGTAGAVFTPLAATAIGAQSVLVQSDNTFVIAGGGHSDFAVARYNSNGSLDATMGGGSPVFTDFRYYAPVGSTDYGYYLLRLPDGKLLQAGTTGQALSQFGLARFNPDGSPDESFGFAGRAYGGMTGIDHVQTILRRSDGKILVAGDGSVASQTQSHREMELMQFNADGSVDQSFGNHGGFVNDISGSGDSGIDSIAIQSDGKILVGGHYGDYGSPPNRKAIILRYNADGSPDTTFNSGIGSIIRDDGNPYQAATNLILIADDSFYVETAAGLVHYFVNGNLDTTFAAAIFGSVLRLDDGRFLNANILMGKGGLSDVIVRRYLSTGALDTTFGLAGLTSIDWSLSDTGPKLAIAPDGKIVVAATTKNGLDYTEENFAVARLNADGSFDSTFGSNGKVITATQYAQFAGIPDIAGQFVVQPDGNIVVAGTTYLPDPDNSLGQPENFMLVRYVGDSPTTARIAVPASVAESPVPIPIDGSGSSTGIGLNIVKYEWDLNHTTAIFNVNSTGPTASFIPADNGVRTIALRVTDSSGYSHVTISQITITNVTPTVIPVPDQTVAVGSVLTLSRSFIDPGRNDNWTGTINWGDGGGAQALSIDKLNEAYFGSKAYAAPGNYTATITITDKDGATGTAQFTVHVVGVVGRYVAYNNSKFDGNDPAANAADDRAIAPDKTALLAGQVATIANYTSYSKGINNVIIDVLNLPAGSVLTSADFSFKTGNDNSPAQWSRGPSPLSITLRRGAGRGGSDRIEIVWSDFVLNDPTSAVANGWLQVGLLANANTGLATSDVFYFGNAVGETGDDAANARVTGTDDALVAANFNAGAAIDNRYDYNRDGVVDAVDLSTTNNRHTDITGVRLITTPATGGFVPASAITPVVSNLGDPSISTAKPATAVTPVPYPLLNAISTTASAPFLDAGGYGYTLINKIIYRLDGNVTTSIPITGVTSLLYAGPEGVYFTVGLAPQNVLYRYTPGGVPTKVTAGGTQLISAGPVISLNGKIIFNTNVGTVRNIYVSDGISNTATFFRTGSIGGSSYGYVYFTDGTPISDLYRTDGTSEGTVLLVHNFHIVSTYEYNGRTLLFGGSTVSGSGMWSSDGTPAGTQVIAPTSETIKVVQLGNELFLQIYQNGNTNYIYRSDGTAAGTVVVTGSAANANYGLTPNLAVLGDHVYFVGIVGNRTALMRSNSAGIVEQVTQPLSSAPVAQAGIAVSNGYVYYSARQGNLPTQVYRSDGTLGGETLVGSIDPQLAPFGTVAVSMGTIGGSFYFLGNDGTHGIQLFRIGASPVVNDNGVLVVNGTDPAEVSTGNDTISLTDSSSTLTVTVNGVPYSFADSTVSSIVVNGLGGDDILDSAQSVVQPLTFNGEAGINKYTFVAASAGLGDTITVTSQTVSDSMRTVTFTGLSNLTIVGSSGNDAILLKGTPAATTVNAGAGSISVVVGDGTLSNIHGAVVLDGGSGISDWTINDALSTTTDTYTFTANSFTRTNGFAGVTFANFSGGMILEAGAGNDLINLTPYRDMPLLIDGGPGQDRLHVDTSGTSNSKVMFAQAGRGLWTFDDRSTIYFTGIERSGDGLSANFAPVSPTPRNTPITSEQIIFSAPVSGFSLANLILTRNGGANLLKSSSQSTLTTADGITWTLSGIDQLTAAAGTYVLALNSQLPDSQQPHDASGSPQEVDSNVSWIHTTNILGRYVFYNGSIFDNNNLSANTLDDAAIAPDKSALLPGQTATFANYTSYNQGINGIMIDAEGLSQPSALTAADFTFQMSTDGINWSTAPAPTSISARSTPGNSAAQRIEILFPSLSIVNTWLRVNIVANAHTGLSAPDVFYFGNLVGGTGQHNNIAIVNTTDIASAKLAINTPATITSIVDFNRSGQVTITDVAIAKLNNQLSIPLFTAPLILTPPPFAAGANVSPSIKLASASKVVLNSTTTPPTWVTSRTLSPYEITLAPQTAYSSSASEDNYPLQLTVPTIDRTAKHATKPTTTNLTPGPKNMKSGAPLPTAGSSTRSPFSAKQIRISTVPTVSTNASSEMLAVWTGQVWEDKRDNGIRLGLEGHSIARRHAVERR